MAQRSDLIFTVPACPRCEQEHANLEFSRLASPIATHGATVDLDIWALCPVRAEPILGMITAAGEVEVR